MDLESLRIFCTVAAELNVTHAAARLGRAPSNVSTRVQGLEADLGVELFVRTGKRLHLSSAGERFIGYAQRLLALEDEARQMVGGGAAGGVLRVGAMESTAASRRPAPLAAYCAQHPATRLEVSTGTSAALLDSVRVGRLDCAFAAVPASFDAAALQEIGLSTQRLWKEKLVLLAPASETARAPAQLQTRALAAFRSGCTYRAIAEDLLGMAGDARWTVQEVGSYHAMAATVAAGACVCLVPDSVLALAGVPAGLRRLPAGQATTSLVWRTGYDAPAFAKLRDCLAQEHKPEYGAELEQRP